MPGHTDPVLPLPPVRPSRGLLALPVAQQLAVWSVLWTLLAALLPCVLAPVGDNRSGLVLRVPRSVAAAAEQAAGHYHGHWLHSSDAHVRKAHLLLALLPLSGVLVGSLAGVLGTRPGVGLGRPTPLLLGNAGPVRLTAALQPPGGEHDAHSTTL